MNRIIKAPQQYSKGKYVFLAGTIDNGAAYDWQADVTDYIMVNSDYSVLNPRRDDWDSSWKQTMHDPQFRQQVEWELNALRECDIIIMYFAGNSLSPISLLELGLFADSGKIVVCCDYDFWRRGNVEVVCSQYNIPLYDDLGVMVSKLFGG